MLCVGERLRREKEMGRVREWWGMERGLERVRWGETVCVCEFFVCLGIRT